MKELVLLIKNHYEAILFVLAFAIAMINLIYLVFTNKIRKYYLTSTKFMDDASKYYDKKKEK